MLAIVNATVITITHGTIPSATVLVEGRKIIAVGEHVTIPPEAEILDAHGRYLMPGMIDPCTHVGLHEEGNGPMGHDEAEPFVPIASHLRALDGIYPADQGFQDCLEGGVTTIGVAPGNAGVICGQVVVLKTAGKIVDEMVVKEPAGLMVTLMGTYQSPNPGRQDQGHSRRDRTNNVALFQAELQKAKEYLHKKELAETTGKPAPELSPKLAPVVGLLQRRFPAIVQAIYYHDIVNAMELAEQWGFDCLLQRVSEGHLAVEELKEWNRPMIVGPILLNRRNLARPISHKTPGLLSAAGLRFALSSHHPAVPIGYLASQAAIAVREGMAEEEGLKAITLYPAQILGLDDRLGSIEPGKDADLVLMTDHPFETLSWVDQVWIAGRSVFERGSSAC